MSTLSCPPLQVVVACQYATLSCPTCHASQPGDFHLVSPTAAYRHVLGINQAGGLVVDCDSYVEDFPGNAFPSHWLQCTCGTRFSLPAGTIIDYAERAKSPELIIKSAISAREDERLTAADVSRSLPTDTRPTGD